MNTLYCGGSLFPTHQKLPQVLTLIFFADIYSVQKCSKF